METSQIVVELNNEISRLQRVRALLTGNQNEHVAARPAKKKHHAMSAEGRERIAAAQRKRWAKQKKAAKKTA
jgi:hypothetical protein